MQDEEGLVSRAKNGDREAWARLYEENFDRIYRFLAARSEGAMEAEDMTEQVFLKAYQSLDSFRWRGVGFAPWLFRIARNQAIDRHRRKGLEQKFLSNPPPPPGEKDLEALVEEKAMLEEVLGHLPRLTLAQQEVIKLRFAAELSIQEVAQVLGKSPGAIKALQHAAIEALRQRLGYG